MGSVFGSAFGSPASGIVLRAAVCLFVFVAEATGVSKISSIGVSLGDRILRFPLLASPQPLARALARPSSKSPVSMPLKRHLPSRSYTAMGQSHRRELSVSSRPPPNPSVKGTCLRQAPYVER
jgi:hypothetical protein